MEKVDSQKSKIVETDDQTVDSQLIFMSGNYFFQVSKSLKEDKIKIIKKRTKMLSTIFHNKFVTIVKYN